MRSRSTAAAGALLLLALSSAGGARADERASAEELFQRGRQAMDKKDFPRACELLEASLKLEDTLGTLLNVALCHEAVGRIATAWGEFRAVEQRALRSTPVQTGRVDFARQHAEALQPKLPRLKVTLDPSVDARVVEIRVDGKLMATEALVEGTPADPGKRTVHASSPKKIAVDLTVDVAPGPATTSLTVPALANAPTPATPGPAGASATDIEAVAAARSRRTAGFVTGGIGLAFVAAGGVLGALALVARGDATCPSKTFYGQPGCFTEIPNSKGTGTVPNPDLKSANDAYSRATVFANLSTGAFILGAVGLGVGIYLVATTKVVTPPKTGLVFGPSGVGTVF